MSHSAFSRSLRIMALACAAAMLCCCATQGTWEYISPDPTGYMDEVTSVTSAHQRDDGSVVVCVNGYPAAIPALLGDYPPEAFSLILPADTADGLAIDDAHPSLRRYDLTGPDVAGACVDSAAPGTPLPVHTIYYSDLGFTRNTLFKEIPDGALAELFDSRARPPAVHVYGWGYGSKSIIYVAPEPRFDGARAVVMSLGHRPVEGNPAYIAALPVAVVVDVLMLPVYLYFFILLASAQP